MGNVPRHIGQQRREKFLEAFSVRGNVMHAAKAAGVARSTVYEWLETDEGFRARYEHAAKDAADHLLDEAWRRGHDGVDKPVFYQGAVCGTVKEYSDTLLWNLLKGLDRERFGDRSQQDLTVKGGVEIYLPQKTIDPEAGEIV